MTQLTKEINDTFKEYYTNLYSSEFPEDTSNMLIFLDGLNIPKINLEQKENLEQPINLQEVIDSINAMQSSKTPGPGRYPVEQNSPTPTENVYKFFRKCKITTNPYRGFYNTYFKTRKRPIHV